MSSETQHHNLRIAKLGVGVIIFSLCPFKIKIKDNSQTIFILINMTECNYMFRAEFVHPDLFIMRFSIKLIYQSKWNENKNLSVFMHLNRCHVDTKFNVLLIKEHNFSDLNMLIWLQISFSIKKKSYKMKNILYNTMKTKFYACTWFWST